MLGIGVFETLKKIIYTIITRVLWEAAYHFSNRKNAEKKERHEQSNGF
jgi:hypothetical protein